jgi:hypothetical protein
MLAIRIYIASVPLALLEKIFYSPKEILPHNCTAVLGAKL